MRGRAWRNGVHVGRDGWLFWLGRRGEMRRLYRGGPAVRLAVWRWARLIARRQARAAAIGSRYLQAVVPDKLSVCDGQLAEPLVDGRRGIGSLLGAAVLRSSASGCWVDLEARLRGGGTETPLYLRTDTHWTFAGSLAATRAVCEALGIAPVPHIERPTPLDGRDFTFDLGRKLDPPASEHLEPQIIPLHAGRVEENALARIRREPGMANAPGFHVGSRTVLRTDHPDAAPLRVVLFGDSYSSEEGYTLGVMLAESVRELHSVWSANIDWAYVERVRPDVVIHEIAERFLRRVPTDRFDADALAAKRAAGRGRRSLTERIAQPLRRLLGPRPVD